MQQIINLSGNTTITERKVYDFTDNSNINKPVSDNRNNKKKNSKNKNYKNTNNKVSNNRLNPNSINEIVNKDTKDTIKNTAVETDVVIDKPIENKINYKSRDLSWLQFNERVLDLADSDNVPLMERIKFLSISASNLDEFAMVRLSKLNQLDATSLNIMNTTIKNEITLLNDKIEVFIDRQNRIMDKLTLELKNNNIEIVSEKKELNKQSKDFIRQIFEKKIKSMLTPLVFDNARPFPIIPNNVIHIGVIILNDDGTEIFGTIRVPRNLERVIEIKEGVPEGKRQFILLEDVIIMNLDSLFVNKTIDKICVYRVLRNFDYTVKSNKVFLADEVKETLKRRQANDIVRLDISGNKKEFAKILNKALHINKECINKTKGIVDLTFCMDLSMMQLSDKDRAKWTYSPFHSQIGVDVLDEDDIFDKIDDQDIILHHPYESYDTVLEFIDKAAKDDNVVAIKQTLYRISRNSPIVKSLITAAENGKEVTVLLEVKARFDEENNLRCANELEKAGAHVIYGVPGLKTHCKICLVVKKNKKGNLTKYCHIGTGNYNEKNAKIYTDISLFSSKDKTTEDIEALFNYLTGYSLPKMHRLLFSPITLVNSITQLIDKEIENKKNGLSAGINIKVNALTDKAIIDKLYEAADNGVHVNLIVRSACSLIARENITVKSIVGRFLEHSRLYYFNNNNDPIYMISSADLMERNLYNRVELAIKLKDSTKDRVKEIFDIFLSDDSNYIMDSNGDYIKQNGEINAQEIFMKAALENNNLENINKIFTRKS